jgi:NTP pyrophosphatase (non-canonical NTP hydrolase)
MNKEQVKILYDLVQKYGDKQIIVCIEEMSELTKELCKNIRGHYNLDKIYEEMADVYIMLAQMQILLQMEVDALEYMINKKIERTKERLLDN